MTWDDHKGFCHSYLHHECKKITVNFPLALQRPENLLLYVYKEIVAFFNRQDKIKAVKLKIRRGLAETSFDEADPRKAIMDRRMERFKGKPGK